MLDIPLLWIWWRCSCGLWRILARLLPLLSSSACSTTSGRTLAAWRCHDDACIATASYSGSLLQARIIDEVPLVVLVVIVEFLYARFLARAGYADDPSASKRLSIADV